ncbi:hypothetical protein CMUS01_12947 [Colletotrichum musicola]|uniref:2EXR domain-containing protein n=1 Tax=Colletotrichum musicola TaxID=2175873 RepID=A0A8H6MYK1_9PEZI|nr:hypothetical protein CMUS01_12947 [Colletotrichum musicola]
MTTTSTFHPFPRLLFELRARIWELTVEPRVVELRVALPMRHIRFSTPVPAQLQTCREAREHLTTHHDARLLYEKSFYEIAVRPRDEGTPDPERERYVWFNFEVDILSIGEMDMMVVRPIAHQILRLRLERPLFDEWFGRFEWELLSRFRRLVEVQFVCLNGDVRTGYQMAEDLVPWLAPENVYFADPDDVDGTMINSVDLDDMINREYEEKL